MPPGRSPHQAYCAGRAQQLLLPGLPALVVPTPILPSEDVTRGGRILPENVLVGSLNRLLLCEAAQAKGGDVHKRRPPLGNKLSHTCPHRWGDLKARYH